MTGKAGLLGLVLKVGPKFLSILAKSVKSLKIGKFALAAFSFASYAYLWTWQFAAMIMILLFIHESGHLWAMKRCGIKTRGIYFIPFVGGAAVTEGQFPTRGAESYIAIMGPIWGLILSLATALVYYATNSPIFAAAASWMAMINLFNLLPIDPLDGGRIMKSVAFSINSNLGIVFLALGMIAGVILAVYARAFLFVIILIAGGFDLMFEYKGKLNLPRMSTKWIAGSALVYSLVVILLWELMVYMQHVPGADIAMEVFK